MPEHGYDEENDTAYEEVDFDVETHIVPINDKKKHIMDKSCKCCPTQLNKEGEPGIPVYLHHPFDFRDIVSALNDEASG